MAMEKPPLAVVSPGEPVTAQGWNALVDALSGLYDAVLALGGEALQLQVSSSGEPIMTALAVALPVDGGQPVLAIPPYGEITHYTLSGLTPGAWRLHVAAPGFVAAVRDIEVPAADPVPVNLDLAGAIMPDVFGRPAPEALQVLSSAGVQVSRILDITGRDLPPGAAASEFDNAPVLAHTPDPGTIVPVAARARLVLAASIKAEPVIEVPSLAGLTLTEAARVIEDLGLVLGGTKTLETTGR